MASTLDEHAGRLAASNAQSEILAPLSGRALCRPLLAGLAAVALLSGCGTPAQVESRRWLAGDHHIHSRYSVGWDAATTPPSPVIGGDAIYPIPMNALMGRRYGLSWMVATDHGGPNHSKLNLERAYPELLESRAAVTDVVQFFGLELNTPAGEHSSVIVPHTHDEARVLFDLERRFDSEESFPTDPARDTEAKMLDALRRMRDLPQPPVVIVNHPARTNAADGSYGAYRPDELRRYNETAPEVAIGMAGAPGHQAIALVQQDPAPDPSRLVRGGYGGFPTLGGFDVLTAKLGGFWDSMLGEGRRWWITANSDSHEHFTEGGVDFWPGEYSKTYVFAAKNHDDILASLRAGRVFVTTGDLISELYVEAAQGDARAAIGGAITVAPGSDVTLTIRLRDPDTDNAGGNNPSVRRVDLIVGDVRGRAADPTMDDNPTTRVARRFEPADWRVRDGVAQMTHTLRVNAPLYVRVRGTSTDELEPEPDPPAEYPWDDLWFYSNPIFVEMQ